MKTRFKLAPVAAAVAIAAPLPALAFEPISIGDGYTFEGRLNLTYTLSQRVEGQDPLLTYRAPTTTAVNNAGANDGDNNFKKNALTANRLAGLLETKLTKGDSGVVFDASSFYDDVYHRTNDNNPAANNPYRVNKPAPFNEFTDGAKYYQGGYSRVLNAYAYTSFDFGADSRATIRLGRHAVNWGEAVFYPNIAQAQGPFDGTKQGIPGTETKDSVLSEDQISASIQMTPRWTLLGQAQFAFHPTIAPAAGSYLSTSDATGPGARCLGPWTVIPAVPSLFAGFNGCSFGNRGDDIKPNDIGQWGIGTRYRVTEATELGLYYLNFNDRTPLPVINAFTPGTPIPAPLQAAFGGITQIGNGSYRVRYFDHVELLGATASTSLGVVSVAGEISYRRGAPVLVNTVVNPATGATIPNPTRADITTAAVNMFYNVGRTPLSSSLLLLGEVSGSFVGSVDAIKAPGVEALGPAAAFFPASNNMFFQTKSAVAYTLQAVPGWPGIFENWDLTVPISFAHQVKGRSLVGTTGGEGDMRVSVGATMVYGGNLSVGLTYLGFLNKANLAPKTSRLLTDRDQISLAVKYSF